MNTFFNQSILEVIVRNDWIRIGVHILVWSEWISISYFAFSGPLSIFVFCAERIRTSNRTVQSTYEIMRLHESVDRRAMKHRIFPIPLKRHEGWLCHWCVSLEFWNRVVRLIMWIPCTSLPKPSSDPVISIKEEQALCDSAAKYYKIWDYSFRVVSSDAAMEHIKLSTDNAHICSADSRKLVTRQGPTM